jgi:hypothetical protein
MPSSGFGMDMCVSLTGTNADKSTEDPSEFFTMIFGGEAFVDWYAVFSATWQQFSVSESGS